MKAGTPSNSTVSLQSMACRLSYLLAAALGTFTAMGLADAGVPGSQPRFQSALDLVTLNVTVTTAAREYVHDLGPQNFVVFEDDVPQHVTMYPKTNVSLAVALLLDSSASMRQALATAQDAAVGFTRSTGAVDLVSIIDFDSKVKTVQPFTSNGQLLEDGIRRTSAGGSTALYNAVYIGLHELKKVAAAGGADAVRRRAIVVLSDGDDTASLLSFAEVLKAASQADAVIYAVGLEVEEPELERRLGMEDGAYVLRRLAAQTGGRAFFPTHPKELADIYSTIRQDLANQYSLTYESSNPRKDGAWRRIGVQVNQPSLTVRTRPGYFAPRR